MKHDNIEKNEDLEVLQEVAACLHPPEKFVASAMQSIATAKNQTMPTLATSRDHIQTSRDKIHVHAPGATFAMSGGQVDASRRHSVTISVAIAAAAVVAVLALVLYGGRIRPGVPPGTANGPAVLHAIRGLIPEMLSRTSMIPNQDAGTVTPSPDGIYHVNLTKNKSQTWSGICWELTRDVDWSHSRHLTISLRADTAGMYQLKFECRRGEDGVSVMERAFHPSSSFETETVSSVSVNPAVLHALRRICIVIDPAQGGPPHARFSLRQVVLEPAHE